MLPNPNLKVCLCGMNLAQMQSNNTVLLIRLCLMANEQNVYICLLRHADDVTCQNYVLRAICWVANEEKQEAGQPDIRKK